MKIIKKCPLFLLLLSTGIFFTIIAAGGRRTIYAGQEYSPLKAPLLSVMFTGLNEGIYPWQVLENGSITTSGPMDTDLAQAEASQEDMADPGDVEQKDEQVSSDREEVPPAKIPSQETAKEEGQEERNRAGNRSRAGKAQE